MAFFIAYIQQTQEQWFLLRTASRDPTHWTKTTLFGFSPLESFLSSPLVGPPALIILSNSRLVMTSAYLRYPNWDFFCASKSVYPVAMITDAASISMLWTLSSVTLRTAFLPHSSKQRPQSMQWNASRTTRFGTACACGL